MRNVIYACNDGYAKLAGISIMSLLRSNPGSAFRIFLLGDGVSDGNRRKLESLRGEFGNLRELVLVESGSVADGLRGFVKGYGNSLDAAAGGGYTAYARLFFERFVPADVERLVYIDCDTLVIGDISELFSLDLGENPIAMGYDCTNAKYKKVVRLPDGSPYFNSGVLVLDTRRWKERGCLARILEEIRKGVSYPFADQDFLNVCLQGSISRYSFRYNFCSAFFLYRSARAVSFIFGLTGFVPEAADYAESAKNPAVLHFNGNTFTRPWFRNSAHPMKKLYDSYYFSSPWRDEEQPAFATPAVYRLQRALWRFTPRPFFYICSRALQDVFYKMYYKI